MAAEKKVPEQSLVEGQPGGREMKFLVTVRDMPISKERFLTTKQIEGLLFELSTGMAGVEIVSAIRWDELEKPSTEKKLSHTSVVVDKHIRQSGFYWVKATGQWLVAEWNSGQRSWMLPGTSEVYYDEDMRNIGEQVFR